MRATLPTSCFLPYMGYNNTALTSGGFHVLGIMNYAGIDPSAAPIGVAGNTTNPYGAASNPYNSWVYEGCDDMPFNMTVPMRAAAAYEVSSDNMHYMEYSFRQGQNLNRVFLSELLSCCFLVSIEAKYNPQKLPEALPDTLGGVRQMLTVKYTNKDNTAWAPMENNATLLKVADPAAFDASSAAAYTNGSLGAAQQVLLSPNASSGVQLVINSRSTMEHPWHLHGHSPQVVGWGPGRYGADGGGATTWSLDNPARRDTLTVPAMSHVVLRWRNDNPGVWALHCHVAWHMEGGMLMMMAEQPERLPGVLAAMDPTSRGQLYGFCGVDDDQAFGTYGMLGLFRSR